MQPSDWISLGSLGVSIVSACFAIYATVRGWQEKQRGDMLDRAYKALEDRVARDHKILDDRVTRDHQVLLLRLGEDSTRAVELFKRRLDLVGPLWKAVVELREFCSATFDARRVKGRKGDSFVEQELEHLRTVQKAIRQLQEAWDPASPVMKEVRPVMEALIRVVIASMEDWAVAVGQQTGAAEGGNLEALRTAREEMEEASTAAHNLILGNCNVILETLTKFVDARVAEVEASALTSGSPMDDDNQ